MNKIIWIITASILVLSGCATMEGARNTNIAEYKAASQELVKLYNSATTEAAAKAAAAQIHAAIERQRSAAEALNKAMQNLDPNNQEDGKIIENAFSEMQAANDAVSEAQLKSWESQSAYALAETSRGLQKQQMTLETQSVGASTQGDLPPALSSDDLQKVMKWIAQEVSNSRQPYCYRDSYGRGVGTPMKCAAGQQYDAGLCYTPCQDGYKGVGPVCWQSCPPEFRDDGAFCAKPRPYGRGVGYPWKFGDGLNDSGMRGRCERANPQGCEKNGLIYYPKCKPGYHAVGCCICSPNCQLDQTDIGVSCAKRSYGRGVGKPVSTCPGDQDEDAWLCYPQCRSGFHGVGPVCWQDCPSGRTDCGVGCATSKTKCVTGTVDMVIAPLVLAVNIITMGSSSSATSATHWYSGIAKGMKKIADSTKDIRELYKDVKQAGTLAYEINKTIYLWVNDYAGNFESMTTKRVVTELSNHFSGNALLWVKQQYAMNHLTLLLKSDGIETAQNILSTVSTFDPAGIFGVIDAFAKPVCKTDQSFPTVVLLSQTESADPPPENQSSK
jgi:hypothetical protein